MTVSPTPPQDLVHSGEDLRKLAEAVKGGRGFTASTLAGDSIPNAEQTAYIAAANPQAILALLDERDVLRAALEAMKDAAVYQCGAPKGLRAVADEKLLDALSQARQALKGRV